MNLEARETRRSDALARYRILDTPRERGFDDLAALASEICQTPIAVVNLIGEGRQWFKAEVGLGVDETPLDTSFCGIAILQDDFMVVPDATLDPRFSCNPLVTAEGGLRFYAGALLKTAEGLPIGTLCVLDHVPRTLSDYQERALGRLARQVMAQLDLRLAILEREDANAELERRVEERARELARVRIERDRAWAQSQDLLAIADPEGCLVAVNAAWTALLGWTEDELIGRPFPEFTHPDDLEATMEAFAGIFEQPLTTAFEYRFRHREGHYCWFAWTGSFSEGQVYATGRDINAQRQQAEALAAAEDALRQSQKLEAIGQLTGGVAHDFNNLLTVIRGSVDLLRRGALTEEKRARYVDAIGDTADRAAKLTGQLLAFARRQALKAERFDAAGSLEGVATMLHTMVGSRIKLSLHVPDEPFFIEADRSQFDTAVVNLGINARDAMNGQGSLVIAMGPASGIPPIRGHAAVEGDFVAVTVTDTGSGIPTNQIGRIFDPFFTTKSVGEGTGLGLSQVIGFAKQSGGDIRVESTPGEGSVFTLYLPRADPDETDLRTGEREGEGADGHGICVLVVEDNAQVGEFATAALKELGYNSRLATDAAQALSVLESDASGIHVVFSDVVMPGMDGVDLAQQIRRLHPEIPVILASGYSHVLAQDGSHGFELLHKPYSIEQLSCVLGKATASRAGRINL